MYIHLDHVEIVEACKQYLERKGYKFAPGAFGHLLNPETGQTMTGKTVRAEFLIDKQSEGCPDGR